MRYRWSRKPNGFFISTIFLTALSPARSEAIIDGAIKAEGSCRNTDEAQSVRPLGRSPTRELCGVDSSREPDGRHHAPRGDRRRYRHRGMGARRSAAPAPAGTVSRFRCSIGRRAVRMRSPRRRSRARVADGMVRHRDDSHGRCRRRRVTVEPTESSNGVDARCAGRRGSS